MKYVTDLFGRILFLPTFLPLTSRYGYYDNTYDEELDYFYDPYTPDDDDDPWAPPAVPPPEEPVYPEIGYVLNNYFSVFFVGNATGEVITAAKYPYQRTENGDPLFSYKIKPTASGTDFVIADNDGEFIVSIHEQLTGKFCVLLSWDREFMKVKVWGGVTTEPLVSLRRSGRAVTFDSDNIIIGG